MTLSASELETVRCELCGADQPELMFTGPDRLHGLPGQFNVVRCRTCKLIYLNPRPVDLRAYYPEDTYAAHAGSGSHSHFSAAPGRKIGLRRRRQVVLAGKNSGRLLDIGCGAGDFLDVMSQVPGWQVQGLDPSLPAATFARQIHGLDVMVGQLTEVDIPDASFDVVTMWHVLEHMPHPRTTLQEVARILRPGGLLVLTCPIVDSWEARIFGPCWSGYDVPRHLYTFSRKTLGRLLGECGWRYQEVYGVAAGLNSLRISVAFWLDEHLPRMMNVRWARAVGVNLAAALLYPSVWLHGPSRGPGVATFCAAVS